MKICGKKCFIKKWKKKRENFVKNVESYLVNLSTFFHVILSAFVDEHSNCRPKIVNCQYFTSAVIARNQDLDAILILTLDGKQNKKQRPC